MRDEGITLESVVTRMVRRQTGFSAAISHEYGSLKCLSCVRKRYGGPMCCDAGWDRMRSGDPGGCLNWIGWDTALAGQEPMEKSHEH